jgi:hypothetical protein
MAWFRMAMAALACAGFIATPARAAVRIITDEARFDALAPADAVENFDDATLIEGFTIESDHDRWSRLGLMFDVVRQGEDGTRYLLGHAAYAFGAVWDLAPGGVDRGIQLSLLYADGTEQAVAWMLPAVQSGFVGLLSSHPFTGVHVTHAGLFRGQQETYSVDSVAIRYVPVINQAVVLPEPSAWTLAIAGFGAAGAMLRRRRAIKAGPASGHAL